MEPLELLFIAGRDTKQYSLKDSLAVSHKTKHTTQELHSLIFIQNNLKLMSTQKTYIYSFIHKPQTWNQSKCPSTDE